VTLRLHPDGRVLRAALPDHLSSGDLGQCLRSRILRWRLEGLSLPAEQDVQVTLALSAHGR
jgi:hypothetical protein